MSDNANAAYRIKQLENAQGYAGWSTKMVNILTDQDLDDYVIGAQRKEPEVIDEADASEVAVRDKWRKKQRKALSAICLRVGDGPMAYIQKAKTAADAWEKLERVYQPKGAISIIRLRRQLFRATCNEGENIEEHIRHLTQLRSSLETYVSIIEEAEFATTILTSLPDSWDNWVGSIDLASVTESEDIVARILQQAGRSDAKPDADDTALPADTHGKFHACFSSKIPTLEASSITIIPSARHQTCEGWNLYGVDNHV